MIDAMPPRPFVPASLAARLAVLLAVAAGLVACGFSEDGEVTRIAPNELGALANTTSTTSTTTTTVPVTTPMTTTPASLPETTTTSTTIELVETHLVSVFYPPRGDNQSLRRVPVRAAPDATLDDLIRLLYEPPDLIAEINLTTAVTPGLVGASPEIFPLHVVVDLDPTVFDRMTDANQNLAIAQLVLTLGDFRMADGGPVGAVAFEVGGEPISVLIPGQGASDPGEPVGYRQFEAWIEPSTATVTTAPDATTPTEPPSATTGPPSSALTG